MRTKTQIQNVAGEPGDRPEIALIAILASMVLLRMLDIFSPPSPENPGCTPTVANRAVIACASRGDQTWDASSTRVANINGRR